MSSNNGSSDEDSITGEQEMHKHNLNLHELHKKTINEFTRYYENLIKQHKKEFEKKQREEINRLEAKITRLESIEEVRRKANQLRIIH